jgi:hypothetical protein
MPPQAIAIAFLSGLGLVASLVATLAVAALAGSPARSDAWLVALAVPQFLIGATQTGLITAAMPEIAGETTAVQSGRARLLGMAIGLVSLLVALALALSAGTWMRALAPGLDGASQELAAGIARQALCALPFAALSVLLGVAGTSRGQALAVEAKGALAAAVFVAALGVLLGQGLLDHAGWAFALRYALNAALLLPLLRGAVAPPDGTARLRGAAGRFVGFFGFAAIYQSAVIVDRFLLSFADPGAVTRFAITSGIVLALASVLEKGLITPGLPALFDRAKRADWPGFTTTRRRLLRLGGAAGVVAFVLLALGGTALLALAGSALPTLAGHEAELALLAAMLAPCLVAIPAGSVLSGSANALGRAGALLRVVVLAFAAALVVRLAGFVLLDKVGLGAVGVALGGSTFFVLALPLLARLGRVP